MVITVRDKSGNSENITVWGNEDILDVVDEFMGSEVSRFVEQGFDYDKDLVGELASCAGAWVEEIKDVIEDQYGIDTLKNKQKETADSDTQDTDNNDTAGYIKCMLDIVEVCDKALKYFYDIEMATIGDADALDKVYELL